MFFYSVYEKKEANFTLNLASAVLTRQSNMEMEIIDWKEMADKNWVEWEGMDGRMERKKWLLQMCWWWIIFWTTTILAAAGGKKGRGILCVYLHPFLHQIYHLSVKINKWWKKTKKICIKSSYKNHFSIHLNSQSGPFYSVHL